MNTRDLCVDSLSFLAIMVLGPALLLSELFLAGAILTNMHDRMTRVDNPERTVECYFMEPMEFRDNVPNSQETMGFEL